MREERVELGVKFITLLNFLVANSYSQIIGPSGYMSFPQQFFLPENEEDEESSVLFCGKIKVEGNNVILSEIRECQCEDHPKMAMLLPATIASALNLEFSIFTLPSNLVVQMFQDQYGFHNGEVMAVYVMERDFFESITNDCSVDTMN